MHNHFIRCTEFDLVYVFDGTELAKWLSNHLCTSYLITGLQQLKPAWMLWRQPCGVDSTLDSTLDKTKGWVKSLPGCPTGQNWQPCSSVPTILTRSLTAFPPETKWITCGYHYCNFYIKSYSGGSMDPRLCFYSLCSFGYNSRLRWNFWAEVIFRFSPYFNFN